MPKARVIRPGSKAVSATAVPAAAPPPPVTTTTTAATTTTTAATTVAAAVLTTTIASDRAVTDRAAISGGKRKLRVISAADSNIPDDQKRDLSDWHHALAPEATARWQLIVKPATGYSNSFIDVKRARASFSASWKGPLCVTQHPRMSPLDIVVYKKKVSSVGGGGGGGAEAGNKLSWTRAFDWSSGHLPEEVTRALPTAVIDQKLYLIWLMKAIRDRILTPLCNEFMSNLDSPVCKAQRESLIETAAMNVARLDPELSQDLQSLWRRVITDKTGKYKVAFDKAVRFEFMYQARVKIAYPEGELENDDSDDGGGGSSAVLVLKDGDEAKMNNYLRMNDIIALEATPERVPDFHMWIRDKPFRAHDSKAKEQPPIPSTLTKDTPAAQVIKEMTRVGWDFRHVKLYSGVDGGLIEQSNERLDERLILSNSVICAGMCFKIVDLSKEGERLTVQIWHDPYLGIRLDVPGHEQDDVIFVPANAFARVLERTTQPAAAAAEKMDIVTATPSAATAAAAPPVSPAAAPPGTPNQQSEDDADDSDADDDDDDDDDDDENVKETANGGSVHRKKRARVERA